MRRSFHLATCFALALLMGSVARAQVQVEELHSFPEQMSHSALIQASDGNSYGTSSGVSSSGEPLSLGTVYRRSADGVVTVLHAFTGGADGAFPLSGLVEGPDGWLYGTTEQGGASNYGTIFKVSLDGALVVVHNFTNGVDGGHPNKGGLTLGIDGHFYGASVGHCDTSECGSVLFKLTASGTFTPLHSFGEGCAAVQEQLVQAEDGNFYGTAWCGERGQGRVFRLTPAGVVTVIHDFTTASDGDNPNVRVPTASSGALAIDVPQSGNFFSQIIVLRGWAIDRAAQFDSGVDAVHVWARPLRGGNAVFIGEAAYGGNRADVAAVYGPQFSQSGFAITARGLPLGPYEFVVTPHSSVTNTFDVAAARTVTVNITQLQSQAVYAAVDAPGPDTPIVLPRFRVSGWAVDLGATTGAGIDAVHVWAIPEDFTRDPVFLGVAHLGEVRPDIAAAFGPQFLYAGYSLVGPALPAGRYMIDVAWRSALGEGYFQHLGRNVVVRADPDTRLTIDGPLPGTVSQPFLISGWAIDLATAGGSGVDAVHIWAFPTNGGAGQFLGAAPSSARPDVAAIYGSDFANSGWSLTVNSLAPGTYDLIVFARSTVTNSFNTARVVRVTVQ